MIQKRALGSTGIQVSSLGLGTVKIGRNSQVKNKSPDGFSVPDDQTVLALLDQAILSGVTLLDLSPAYGIAEERIGNLLGSRRSQFILSTKAGEEFDGAESHYNFSPTAILKSVERSLKRLKTDHLDCVLLHLPRNDLATMTESAGLETFARLKDKGVIRSFGASTHTIEGGEYALKYSDVVMVPFNPEFREHESVIRNAEALQKGVFIKKGFMSGHLDPSNPKKTPQHCLDLALKFPAVSSFIVGTINERHLATNIEMVQQLTY